MSPRGEDRKNEIIEQVIERVRERLAPERVELAAEFVRRFFRDVAPADVIEREALDLYGTAIAQLRFGEQRLPGAPAIRVYNPTLQQHGWQSTHTIVEIINDDMPFLVDSVGMELSRHGLGVHLIIHPVLAVRRAADGTLEELVDDETAVGGEVRLESFMHLEIDRQSDRDFLAQLEADLARVLGDVRRAVEDWRDMHGRIETVIADLEPARQHLDKTEFDETVDFLKWLADEHFTFLGYSCYDLEGADENLLLRRRKGTGLGLLRGHDDGTPSRSFQEMPLHARLRAQEPRPPIAVAKANTRSTVHRATYLDFIGVKRYGADGQVIGEHRFLGLFTSSAYNRSPRFIPLLRRKIERIVERASFSTRGHAGKALVNILETYPRDELFQIGEDELFDISTQILYLQDRQHLRLFMRKDAFERFVSCIVYVPRERYNTWLRERLQSILQEALGGGDTDFQALVSESSLARIMFTVRTPNGIPADLDVDAVERRLREASHSWIDRLHSALIEAEGEEDGNRLYRQFADAFSVAYQEAVPARAAVPDIVSIDKLAGKDSSHLAMSLYRRLEDPVELLRFKLIRPEQPIHLSDALPVLENMGLRVLYEEPQPVRTRDGRFYSMHDFGITATVTDKVDVERLRDRFQDAFYQVWSGAAENDGFNRLVLAAGLSAREIVVLRAYCKYLLQLGSPFSQAYIENTFSANPTLAALLVELFVARFDPDADEGEREERVASITQRIMKGLESVAILDEDRILRRYLGLVMATTRTNAFQTDESGAPKEYLSLKFDPSKVPGMPLPRPAYEIFVCSPSVEGVHMRGGKVARGGLRWSDRREDFRTEVLGLMKAQMVKNSVIVPVGAKGGFYVKRPPAGGDRQAVLQEAIRCYKLFLSGLLDITDNRVEGDIVPPPRVVRHDDDDPYLVVAADKGTASFSDYANAVSRSYGFWLDDAFASGGSAGYDHKGMGITARGAWESVKRHFRELGMDPQTDPFTVIGVGDMSGDVFGNGMLMSDKIRLVAAFDHRHIFIDPNPDPAVSFAERKRLFELPRSSWADYDASLISAGGGVYPRTAKSITLSQEARTALGIEAETLSPTELLSAILKAPVDLFWNGGIGTYVKASHESHAQAQDRGNDNIRIDGRELRCRVVGEGGNLGFTQYGRIEAARNGVRLNTDFIDNSAGVDCSDHEVNIKILLGDVVASGDMTMKQRDELLAEMTDEVGELCLRDNTLQNLALSIIGARGHDVIDAQIRFMRKLEAAGRLNRAIEMLPDDEELEERRRAGLGLTRPENAVLLAYAKTTLFADLLETELPDREYFARDLAKYFPRPLRRRFEEQIGRHRLRREIVATWLSNSLVNRGLDVFVSELEDETGCGLSDITMGYVITRDSFALLPLWSAIETLDRSVDPERQIAMLGEVQETLARGTRWFLANTSRPLSIREVVGRFEPSIAKVIGGLEGVLARQQAIMLAGQVAGLGEAGVPQDLAHGVASLPYLLAACDITMVAYQLEGRADDLDGDGPVDPLPVARIYFAIEAGLNLTWLRSHLRRVPIESRWDRMALGELENDLAEVLRRLTIAAIADGVRAEDAAGAAKAIERWMGETLGGLDRYNALLGELESTPSPDLAMLAVAVGVAGKLLPRRLSGVA